MKKEKSIIPAFLAAQAFLVMTISCTEKNFDPNDAQASFAIAKEPYDDKNCDIAVPKLGEFKTRFPYSQYAIEAELLIANCQFDLGQHAEAAASYRQFIKLHPKHPKAAFALYRVAESYWADAPEAIDREQDLTAKAVQEWEILHKEYPQSEWAAKAKELIQQGKRRMAEAEEFVASFYCKQKVWHACAYRYVQLAEKSPGQFKDLTKKALEKAAFALEQLASEKNDTPSSDKNLYFRKFSTKELREQAEKFREKAAQL